MQKSHIETQAVFRNRYAISFVVFAVIMLLAPVVMNGAGESDGPWWWPTQGEWVETQAMTPPDIEDPDFSSSFGAAVAMDGQTLVVGTQGDSYQDNWWRCPGFDRPADYPQFTDGCDWLYVFKPDADGQWVFDQKLVPEDPILGDTFGYTAAVDDESGVIVSGNPGLREGSTREGDPPGTIDRINQIHIFERQEDGTYTESAVIHRNETDRKFFGHEVAVSGHTVVAGDQDRVYVFEKIDGMWQETDQLPGSTAATVIKDDMLLTTVFYEDPDGCRHTPLQHYIQVYHRIHGEWVAGQTFKPSAAEGEQIYTGAGQAALSEDGKTLLLGGPMDRRIHGVHTEYCVQATIPAPTPVGDVGVTVSTAPPAPATGSAWVFELIDGEWVETADIPNPMPDDTSPFFGISVAISGDIGVIGSGDFWNGPGGRSGAAYVYEKIGDRWQLQAKLRNHDSGQDPTFFGYEVGISGTSVVVGAKWNGRSGTAHAFERLGPLAGIMPPE